MDLAGDANSVTVGVSATSPLIRQARAAGASAPVLDRMPAFPVAAAAAFSRSDVQPKPEFLSTIFPAKCGLID
jgi:hypothetical protein